MQESKPYSKLIRVICGILALGGLWSIGFKYFLTGEFSAGILLFGQLFATFVFAFVAIWGTSPIQDRLSK